MTLIFDCSGMNSHLSMDCVRNGSSLTRMTVGSDTLTFGYDASGKPLFVQWNNSRYFYATNLQGDVVAIVSVNGIPVVEYTYDAWGNILSITGTRADNLGQLNPLRYRGYVYDNETGLYYLQSRYYDPSIGRFINSDSLVSTGQGILGNNMFTYCRNNPTRRKDAYGTADDEAILDIFRKLEELLDKYATVDEYGFTIDLEAAATNWDACIKEVGIQAAYDYMGSYLCKKYLDTYGEEFLFSENCVSYEIEYHVDAYMCMQGYSGYSRNITTLFFSKDYLIDHCNVVNISTKDTADPKQAIMFDYRNGIRSKYVGTDKDPYYLTTINVFGFEIILR